MIQKSVNSVRNAIVLGLFATFFVAAMVAVNPAYALQKDKEYTYWKEIGHVAGLKALGKWHNKCGLAAVSNAVVLTNAGYAEIKDRPTTGALDGIAGVFNAKRGNHSLIEIHSACDTALWFAVFNKKTGDCVYLQVNPDAIGSDSALYTVNKKTLFAKEAMEKIDAETLFANPAVYAVKFDNKVFGGNEFRIVTISNAVAAGAPACAVRSFEFHDHYCPGVTSGILMALYIKKYMAKDPAGSYFVQSVQPWCKEDALVVMLNTTPGKSGYHVSYPTASDMASWKDEVKNASTIIYRKDPATGIWDGVVLGYKSGVTGCPSYGHSILDKLCADLWYLKYMDQPEKFITVLHEFELPAGVTPQSYARPGVDPMNKLGLVK